jgi:hypothetical protein
MAVSPARFFVKTKPAGTRVLYPVTASAVRKPMAISSGRFFVETLNAKQ